MPFATDCLSANDLLNGAEFALTVGVLDPTTAISEIAVLDSRELGRLPLQPVAWDDDEDEDEDFLDDDDDLDLDDEDDDDFFDDEEDDDLDDEDDFIDDEDEDD